MSEPRDLTTGEAEAAAAVADEERIDWQEIGEPREALACKYVRGRIRALTPPEPPR
jgi:hypothetical protein